MKHCNSEKLMLDAAKIVQQLKEPDTILTGLMKEYHCGHALIMKAVLSQITKTQWNRIRKKKLSKGNIKTQFQKNHIPFNKDMKGIHLSLATEFKKGHLPFNHRPTGSRRLITRTRKGNTVRYWEIKTSGIFQGEHKWIPYAKYVWEQKNGHVPVGRFVVHFDGNLLNDNIENLQVVTRQEHLALQMERDPKMLKRCRRNAGRAAKKRFAKARKIKARFAKHQRIEARDKLLMNTGIDKLRGRISQWWECTGCGYGFQTCPPSACPKCGHRRFKKIEQRIAV